LEKLKNCVQKYIPRFILDARLNFIRAQMKRYVKNLAETSKDKEIEEISDFLKNNPVQLFPYEWIKHYKSENIDAHFDEKSHMYFVYAGANKLYFPKNFSKQKSADYYNSILIEQDEHSPHRYETGQFKVSQGDVIAEIGAAEAFWTLSNIEKVKEAYIFECEESWIEALQKTFEPWKEKVFIVKKYVSDLTGTNTVSLDDFFKDKNLDFIKADIEGAEVLMLKGAAEILKRNKFKAAVCAYHRNNHAKDLKRIFENNGFKTEYSKGYMMVPSLRRGLIRAEKTI